MVRKWKCKSDSNLGILIIRKGNMSNDYDEGFYSTEHYADNLLRYLRDRTGARKSKKRDDENLDEDEPFFAFLPFSAPHWPLQCDKADRDTYKGVYDEGPGVLREKRLAKLKELGFFDKDVKPHDVVVDATPEWEKENAEERALSARAMECYAGMVEGIDRNCGKVFDYLKSTGEYDSTLRLPKRGQRTLILQTR
jgi:arylsulfatase A-like enzyme